MSWIPYTALVLGLAGSLHCMGMCGPLVMSMPFRNAQGRMSASSILFYHLGKLTTYSSLGLVAGLLGRSFAIFHWQQALSLLAGIVLLLLTFIPILKKRMSFGGVLSPLFSRLHSISQQLPNTLFLFLSGLLNGLLPCGLVYAAIAGAAATADVMDAVLFMFFFGVGTIPSLSSVILLQQKINLRYRQLFSRSAFYLSVTVGVLLLLRGMNLGVPYISPHLNTETMEMSCCHRR